MWWHDEAAPAKAPTLRIARLGTDVPAHLVQLVAREEHAIPVAELELEVVPRHAAHGLGLEPGEAGDPVVLVHHGAAGAKVCERGQRPRAARPRAAARPRQILSAHRGRIGRASARQGNART